MVTSDYTHIWDCCCDHGYIGGQLLAKNVAPFIHFVDIVPQLIKTLNHTLSLRFSDQLSNWKTHCIDVEKLPLKQYDGKQLVIIAGVGGDMMVQIIDSIHANNRSLPIDYLLCPIRRQYKLREKLIQLDFSLLQECLVEENRQFYEIVLVSSSPNKAARISNVGSDLWISKSGEQNTIARKYMNNTIKHYQRIQQGNAIDVKHIIDAYKSIIL
jgi:tRNA (adenine22-N1)-methyltransferase